MHASGRRRSSSSLIGLALSLALATAGAAPVQARPVSTVTGAVVGTGTLTGVPAATTIGSEITFTGHGWGHGRGMGQYGALGYAVDHNWTYRQILEHFYSNTTLGTVPDQAVEVELLVHDQRNWAIVAGNNLRLNGGDVAGSGLDVLLVEKKPNTTNTYTVKKGTGCESASWSLVGEYTGPVELSVPTQSGYENLVRTCEAGNTMRAYRGSIIVRNYTASTTRAVVLNRVGLEDYLRGVVPRESPDSWGTLGAGKGLQALKAQAVAARSYALAGGLRASGARTCDTTACQVYLGAAELGWTGSGYALSKTLDGPNANIAIAKTAGEVRLLQGAIARTEFSSSTGGYTVGGTFPAVIDEGDDTSRNPNHTWTATYATSTIASKLGLSGIRSITVTGRNGLGDWGGRVTQVVVVDGAGVSHTYSGAAFRSAIGTSTFKSDWFTVVTSARTEAENVVRALYQDVLGRGVDPSGLATWTNYVLTTGSPRDLVARLATSRERMNKLVAAQYRLALLREPEPGGLETWVRHLESGHGVYDLQIGIYGSGESLQKLGGGDVPTWVGAVYSALLGRPASASEQQYWAARASTYGRASVVAGIAGSSEASMRRLTVYYQTFLLRDVDPSGRATFLPMMTGRGDFDVPAHLGGSPEYWARAQTRSF